MKRRGQPCRDTHALTDYVRPREAATGDYNGEPFVLNPNEIFDADHPLRSAQAPGPVHARRAVAAASERRAGDRRARRDALKTNLAVVMAFEDGSGTATSTSTAPLTELIDFNSAGQTEAFTLAYNLASASTATLAGSWSSALSHVTRGGAFRIAAGASATSDIQMSVHRRAMRALVVR
jgi:hypothetical protein